MNKQIKELAEQALKQPDTDNDGLTVFDNDELEKFAELIVKECADVLLKWKDEPFPFDEDLAVSLIKEHFGVKK